MGATASVPKVSLADLIAGIKGISGSTTKTNISGYNQGALDNLMSQLLSSNQQYSKDAAIADATGTTQRVTKSIESAQPQLLSSQLGAGLTGSTTGSLLQNNLVNQILMAEGALQQQQIKDYAGIQTNQATAAANLARAGSTTQETPGVGLQGLIAPLAVSMGGQYMVDKLLGSGTAEAGKQIASTVGGSMMGAPASNTGGTFIGNLFGDPSATVYPNPGVQLVPSGAPVTDYSPFLNTPSDAGMQVTNMSPNSPVSAWDTSKGATGDYTSTAPADATGGFGSSYGFDFEPGYGNVGAGALSAVSTFANGGSVGEAGMQGAKNYALYSNPYTAAAAIVDTLSGGEIGHGLTQVSDDLGIKQGIDDAWQGLSNIASGKGSVICTALAYHNMLSDSQLAMSSAYRIANIHDVSYQYYLKWATPIAKAMTITPPTNWSGKQKLISWGAQQYVKYVSGEAHIGTKLLVSVGLALNSLLAKVYYARVQSVVSNTNQ